MFRDRQLSTDKLTLHVAQGQSPGPPLLLLHGVLRRWSDFAPLLPMLSSRWQLFGLDFRGHGKSGRLPGHYLVRDYVEDAVATLREIAQEPAVLLGHSLGAMVALAVAAQEPERVRAVILEDPPFGTMGRRIGQTMFLSQFRGIQQVLQQTRDVDELARLLGEVTVTAPLGRMRFRLADVRDPAALRFQARCLTQVDPAVLDPIVDERWLQGYDGEAFARQVHCPVLLLQADPGNGGMLIDEDAAAVASALSRACHVRFPKVGHLIHGTATEAASRVIGSFLESLVDA